MEDKPLASESNHVDQHDDTTNANNHGWQKVTYAKRQRKLPSKLNQQQQPLAAHSSKLVNGSDSIFTSLEKKSEERRRLIEAQKAAIAASYETAPVRSSRNYSDDDDDSDADVAAGGAVNGSVDEKKVKPKKVKKPKVTVADAADKIDAADLASFIADVTSSYETQQDIQLMRFADYFGRAFSSVSAAQFPWAKMFRESTLAKIADMPVSHISEAVYKTSVDWINQRSVEALGNFVLWSLDSILAGFGSQQAGAKGSKKGAQQTSSKSQVAMFVVLAMVLRRKPDVLISLLPTLGENSKYQGQDKLPLIVWMIAQAGQGDLAVGLYSWAHHIVPVLGGKAGSNPQTRDLALQLVERFLSAPKARTILVNGAVRKGERLIPPPALDFLLRVTFPSSSARVKATERFEAVYPLLKEVALAGSPGSKAMKQVSQQILANALKAAGEGIPELSHEASSIAVWSFSQSSDCYKQWEKVYVDNVEASVPILRKLTQEWKELSVKQSSLEVLAETLRSFRQKEIEALSFTASLSGDASLALFVQMLGLDRDPSEREQAVVTLRDYSLGGKKYIDDIMKYHGSLNLIVNLLKSDSRATLEAAAGLLRVISSINVYRDMVAESGAIEEIGCLLRRSSLASNVKEESISTLWNLSVDEKLQIKIANSDLLPLLIKFLEDKSIGVMEAVGGVLANLTLSRCNHAIMVEAGVIPKLAELLKTDAAGFKVIKKEAKNALLELAKDEYYKILVMEEGFVFVPLIGAAAYESFRPVSSWPSLPDGTEIKQTSKAQSGFGASEVLLGLHVQDKNINLEEAKVNAMIHRTNQRYLARMGMIEVERQSTSQSELSSWSNRLTILPSMDGVARLVLILELDDESAIARAADAIADASISEHMRVLFKDAGAVKNLVQLMDHHSDSVKLAVIRALERLSVSNDVCEIIEAEGVLYPLIKSLEKSDISESSINMILDILSRLLDPNKELKSRLHNGPDKTTRNAVSVGGENETHGSKSSSLKTVHEGELLDTSFLSCLVEILKTSSPILQRKAASILEFITVNESCLEKIISVNIESGLDAVFRQTVLNGNLEMESETDFQRPELLALQIEEAGLAISASSRLLTRLLDSEQLRRTIDLSHFTKLLRNILISSIPLHNKDWVAACLVKLSSLSAANNLGGDNPINMEVTLYETIPRLIEQISNSLSSQLQEDAVVELNRIISEGAVDSTRAVAAEGGIFPLVKLIQEGNERAVEAGLAILHNLSMDSENHAAIIAAGALPVLRRIVLSERPKQWVLALHLLRTLPT